MVFLKLLIISFVFVAIALAGLGIRSLLKPGGRFPETHISNNNDMKKLGITCAQHTDLGCNPSDNLPGCSCCSAKIL